jgi:hypothetical protein
MEEIFFSVERKESSVGVKQNNQMSLTPMGRCQRAGTRKNKKVTENFPPASVLVCGLRNEIS